MRRSALRIASHNVGGMGCAGLQECAAQAAATWVDLGLHVVAVQECRLQLAEVAQVVASINAAAARRAAAMHKPQHAGFDYKYCINSDPAHPHSAGNLILWQRQLVAAGSLQVLPETAQDRDARGRLMVLHVKWGGHTIHLVNVYCPNASVDRQAYISATLAPLWTANPTNSIFLGNWNYVDDPAVDRRCICGQPTTSDAPSMRAWQAAAPGAADAFRCLHPTRRSYTFIHRNPLIGHVARHDRAYIGSALLPSLVSCSSSPSTVSDHFPLVLELAPLQPPQPTGPGLARARVDF